MRLCKSCQDTGWVCETHPTRAWSGTRCCGCGAAGIPCPRCSSELAWDKPPDYSKLFQSASHLPGKKVN
jgi:hypothetical protein